MLAAFGAALSLGYFSGEEHPQQQRVDAASEACRAKLGHSNGIPWTDCVIQRLLDEQEAAREEGRADYFPLHRHTYEPLAADRSSNAADPKVRVDSELLKNLMRNFSCDVEDGGSEVVRSMTWRYAPPDPCSHADVAGAAEGELESAFVRKSGFLPAGNDLPELGGVMSLAAAQAACEAEPRCRGFTYVEAPGSGRSARDSRPRQMHFKSAADGVTHDPSWVTHKRRSGTVDCRPGRRAPPPSAKTLTIDVLRESPPVYIVRDFATPAECSYMMNQTIPNMVRSVTFGGGATGQVSSHRRSYSVNMFPDYDDETNVITRMVRRKFAFAREVADYEQLRGGVLDTDRVG